MPRRRLDFDVAGKRKKDDQHMVDDNMAASESSSRDVLPSIAQKKSTTKIKSSTPKSKFKSLSDLYRDTVPCRRLDFDVAGKQQKDIADDQQIVGEKKAACESSSRCVGIHLDNIAQNKSPIIIESPSPKSKLEDSPVFKYMNTLSPIGPIKSTFTAHNFDPRIFRSPSPVFGTPKPSRLFRSYFLADQSNPLESQEGSVSNEEVIPSADVDLTKEEIESAWDLLPLLLSECQTPDHGDRDIFTQVELDSPYSGDIVTEVLLDSPYTGDIVTQVVLTPSNPSRGDNGSSSEDVTMGLQNMLDVQEENDTFDYEQLISDATELLVLRSPNDSVALTCQMGNRSSSERRICAGFKPTKQHDITKDFPVNVSSNEPLAVLLELEVAGKQKKDMADDQQILGDNKAACESSSRCILPKKPIHEDTIMDADDDASKTPASARHKDRCKCKKTSCVNGYCQCYLGRVGCSRNCKCKRCENPLGRKVSGSLRVIMESKQEEDRRDSGFHGVGSSSFRKPDRTQSRNEKKSLEDRRQNR